MTEKGIMTKLTWIFQSFQKKLVKNQTNHLRYMYCFKVLHHWCRNIWQKRNSKNSVCHKAEHLGNKIKSLSLTAQVQFSIIELGLLGSEVLQANRTALDNLVLRFCKQMELLQTYYICKLPLEVNAITSTCHLMYLK